MNPCNLRHRSALLTAMALLLAAGLRADPYFVVPPDTPDHEATDFLSWETAATNIQDAVTAAAVTNGATVWVKPGHYVLNAQIEINDLKLRSWPDGLTNRDTTIVNGNYPHSTNRCFRLNNAAALVEGFTITNSFYIETSAEGGGGVMVHRGTLRNCRIVGNKTTTSVDASYRGGGGGVSARYADSLIDNCIIEHNWVGKVDGLPYNDANGGGGVRLYGGAVLQNSIIRFNEARDGNYIQGGGGVLNEEGIVRNCVIMFNESDAEGGGVSFARPDSGDGVFMYNSLIARNHSDVRAGGFYQSIGDDEQDSIVESCTIVFNTAAGTASGISRWIGSATMSIYNTIVYHNEPESVQIESRTTGANIHLYHVCTTNVNHVGARVHFMDDGSIIDPPRFADPANDNFGLQGASPCVNAGTNRSWMVGALDLADKPRIDRASMQVDIGAYEFQPLGTLIVIQ